MSTVAPCLSDFSRNIELRVKAGVRNVAICLEKAENKGRMLRHVQDLVLHTTGRRPSAPRSHPFESSLEEVIFLKERRSQSPTILGQEKDGLSYETLTGPPWLERDRSPESSSNDRFVRLIESECGLDISKQYVVVIVQLKVLWQPSPSQTDSSERSRIHLRVSFDKSIPAIWELTAAEGLQEGDTFWFAARSAITTMAMTPSFGDRRLSITADVDDGRSQHLGAFTMSSILSYIVDIDRVTKSAARYSFPFLRQITFVAEGHGAQGLQRLTDKFEPVISKRAVVQTRQNLALLRVTVGSATDLAMSVAHLRANIEDDTDIRDATQITPSSLGCLDDLLLSLEAETKTIHELAMRQDAFGYTLADIREIMEMQLVADDSFGAMEESHVGFWS